MELLTGDTNILNVALVLQYVIRDPADFLFQIKDTSAFIEAVAEAVLDRNDRRHAHRRGADPRTGRGAGAGQGAKPGDPGSPPQRYLDRVREHNGHDARPIGRPGVPGCCGRDGGPRDDDQRGSGLPEQPDPQGARRCATLLSEAEAYKQQRIAEAVGGASRFLSLQKEYEKGRDITRTRLYLEAVEKILPKVQLYVIDSDKGRVPLHLRMSGP